MEKREVRQWALALLLCLAACHEGYPERDEVGQGAIVLQSWSLEVEGKHTSVMLPTHVAVPDHDCDYRLVTEATLPTGRGPWFLVVPSPGAAMSLNVNGKPAVDTVSDLVEGYRRVGPRAFRITDEAVARGQLSLELVIQHRWTQSAWFASAPRLTTDPASETHPIRWVNFILGIVAAVCLLQIGMICFGVYLFDRRRRAYLFFGIQAVLAASYPLHTATLLQPLFGRFDGAVLASLLTCAGLVSVDFLHAFFELRPPSIIWRVLLVSCGIVMPLLAAGPYTMTPVAGRTTVLTVCLSQLYVLTVLAKLAWGKTRPPRGARVLFWGWLVMVSTACPDLVTWLGFPNVTGGLRATSFGLTFLALTLSFALTREHQDSLHRSDNLNADLEGRVKQLETNRAEIEQLNLQLRQQIAGRAKLFLEALTGRDMQTPPTLIEGSIVSDRYRVEGLLGSGGMGAVYEVERLTDGKHFALKSTHSTKGVELARLAREAHIVSTLVHPNIVGIVDVDVAVADDGGYIYFVMDLVRGPRLADIIDEPRPMEWKLLVLRQIAEGVAAMHAAGVVHRDVTPANVLLSGNVEHPVIKVTDFGISREHTSWEVSHPVEADNSDVDDEEDVTSQLYAPELTQAGFLSGTPMYMAPELVRSHAITPAADMFGLGVLAYRLIEGRSPFEESVAMALIDGRQAASQRPFSRFVGELANAFSACLSVEPGLRPTAEELGRLLATATP